MMTRYRTLSTLRVTHAYNGGVTALVEPVIPEESAALMRRGRILAKALNGTLHLLYEGDAAGIARVALPGAKLRVGLRVVDSSFDNVTDPASLPAMGVAYWHNRTSPAALDAAVGLGLVGSVFEHTLTGPARPIILSVEDASGVTIHSEVVTAAQGRTMVSLDLAGVGPGIVTVREVHTVGPPRTTSYLLHPELGGVGVIGVVDVDLASAFYTTAPAFEIALAARGETLRYYLVVTNYNAAELASLRVVDAGFTEDARAEILFDRVPSASWGAGELPVSQLGGPAGATYVLYRSRSPVTRQQRARKRLELRRGTEVLIPHLAQPRPEQPNANIIVHMGK